MTTSDRYQTQSLSAAPAAPRVPALGTTLAGRYRLDGVLGRGGMGVVFLGHDIQLNREVAIKVVGENRLDDGGRRRLLQEARAAAALNHPNVVTVYDVGEHEGAPYVVMERVRGTTLHEARDLPLPDFLQLLLPLCDALAHAHERDLVHRDLKPENVLVGDDRSERSVKLVDLGVAVSIQTRRATEDGAIQGTVSYMAPEQALGRRVDARADLYSLGVMLYERATRRLPFEGDNPIAILSQHIHAPVVPPRVYTPRLSPGLEQIILKLLAKNPEDRYSSAVEVADAIRSMLEDRKSLDPFVAPRPGPAPRPSAEPALGPPSETLSNADRLLLGLGGLVRGRLVGREKELSELQRLWSLALQNQAQLALISGEPGSGKTRLAREIAVAARVHGAPVLSGGCYEYEAATPYLPFVEAIRTWVHAESENATLAQSLGSSAAELARLAPEIETRLGPFGPAPVLPPHEERLRLFDHVSRFFSALAAENGAVIALDDLHWADEGTIGLLHYLRRQLREDRVLLLGTYREVELDRARPLARALVDWNRERIATRIQLQRLTREETGALLTTLLDQAEVPPDLLSAVYGETEGNAFFVEEVVKSLIEQGRIARDQRGWQIADLEALEVPQSVKSAIGARLDRVGRDCIEVLRVAAVIGKDFAFDDLVSVSDKSEDQLLDALDRATAHQLVLANSADSFVFSHDKIREVLYEEVNPIRRRRLHQRVGTGLRERFRAQAERERTRPDRGPLGDSRAPGPAHGTGGHRPAGIRSGTALAHATHRISHADLAFHFIEAGDHAAALEHSMAAATEAVAVFALETALERYGNALESALALGDEDQVVVIEKLAAETAMANGRASEATRYAQSALSRHRLPRADQLSLTGLLAASCVVVGHPQGREIARDLLQEPDIEAHPQIHAGVLLISGRYDHLDGRYRAAIRNYEQALVVGQEMKEGLSLGRAYSNLAGAYQHLAEVPQSMEWARRSVELGQRAGDQDAVCLGMEFLGEDFAGQGRWRQAMEWGGRELELATRIQARERAAWASFIVGISQVGLGNLRNALATLRDAVTLAEEIDERRLQVLVECWIATAHAARGEHEEASAVLARATQRGRQLNLAYLDCELLRASACALRVQRRWHDVLAAAEKWRAILAETEELWFPCWATPYEIEALVEVKQLEAAFRVSDFALQLAKTAEAPSLLGITTGLRARITHLRGEPAEALADFDQAIPLLEGIEHAIPLAGVRVARGRAYRDLGRDEDFAADLAAARAILEECGAAGELSLLLGQS